MLLCWFKIYLLFNPLLLSPFLKDSIREQMKNLHLEEKGEDVDLLQKEDRFLELLSPAEVAQDFMKMFR